MNRSLYDLEYILRYGEIVTAPKWYRRFKIMRDSYAGYEVRVWRAWWPLWLQVDGCNTHTTLDSCVYQILRIYHIEYEAESICDYLE